MPKELLQFIPTAPMNQDSPPPKPDFSEKLTDALIKLLVTGSGGSAIYFLYVDELPKAAIAGVISVATGLLTAFGEGLLGVLKAWLNKQGKQVGKGITQAADRKLDHFSRDRDRYLEALKASCYAVEIEGFQDLPGLALKDVFVPLRIQSHQSAGALSRGQQQIWEFLPTRQHAPAAYPNRRIAILAAPGYGKTTLMRHLTFTYASNPPQHTPPFLPVLLRFREIHPFLGSPLQPPATPFDLPPANGKSALAPAIPSLPELIVRHASQQLEGKMPDLSSRWFEAQLDRGHCLVMFDGLDEVPKNQRDRVRRWVDKQMKTYRHTQFILTSRPHGFEIRADDPAHAIQTDLTLRVLDFNPKQKQEFIEKWYRTMVARLKWEPLLRESQHNDAGERLSATQVKIKIEQESQAMASDLVRQLDTTPALNDLARNPLLITMIATTHRAETTLPKRRVELYDKICNLLLGTRPYAKSNALTLTATGNKAVLQSLAWELVQQERTLFALAEGTPWIQPTLKRCRSDRDFDAAQFWQEMIETAGLLVEKEPGQYEFAHQTFQEYLAALYIKEQGQQARLLENLNNDRWQEVICFYAALGDTSFLIEAILESPTSYTLQLANRCKNEGREVDPQVRDRIEQALLQVEPESSDLAAEVRLEQRFRNLTALDAQTAIDPNYITWGEYQLFLNDQTTGQFYSQAETIEIPQGQANQPVTGISWQDARWFCAWLATQANLQPEAGAYFYRLPAEAEVKQVASEGNWIPFTDSPQHQGNALQVVRVQLGDRYKALLNYLANGRWKKADGETDRVMLEVAGRTDRGYLDEEDIAKFPCEDLRTLDHLWVQFSGGRFGFSVQRNIYVDVGGKLDGKHYKETWRKFCDRVKWREGGKDLNYGQLTFDLGGTPGHLPFGWLWGCWWGGCLVVALLSRRDL